MGDAGSVCRTKLALGGGRKVFSRPRGIRDYPNPSPAVIPQMDTSAFQSTERFYGVLARLPPAMFGPDDRSQTQAGTAGREGSKCFGDYSLPERARQRAPSRRADSGDGKTYGDYLLR